MSESIPFLRRATADDVDLLVRIEAENEGYQSSYMTGWTDADRAAHRRRMLGFLIDDDKFTFVLETTGAPRQCIGLICARLVDVRGPLPEWSVFRQLPVDLLPADGRVCELFMLWVDRAWRRRGLATQLKLQAEQEATRRGIKAIYTHTEANNEHIIAFNLKLGYTEIRRGPIWDSVPRVSLLKRL